MFLLYNFLLTLVAPFWVPWMWYRTAKRKEKPNWKERQGDYAIPPRKDRKRIWFHAVSVGEVVACLPVLRETKALLPDHEIVLSVTTSSGHKTAREQASGLYDHLFYFPIDVVRFQLSAMQRVQPAVVAVMETELWMNFLWAAKVFETRTLLVNGRISDRSFPRSRKLKFFYKTLLANMDRCLMQTQRDADRIRELGGKDPEVFGNCKFDQALEGLDADPRTWMVALGLPQDRPVIVVGSTRGEDEEALVLAAVAKIGLDKVSVVHAPRHLERVPALADAARQKLRNVRLRSSSAIPGEENYVILDTYGELSEIYSVASVVIIGGGFGEYGGQNLIQPLAHGKPVLHGPHMQNFRDAAGAAHAAGATLICSTADELAAALDDLLKNESKRLAMGEAAKRFVQSNLGASRRYAEAIAKEVRALTQ